MTFWSLAKASILIALVAAAALPQLCHAQETSSNQSWTSTSQQSSLDGATNPTHTRESHTETDGRVVDHTSVDTMGPDGRYVPYSDTEKESRRINNTTVRSIVRTFGRDADGHRVLIQQTEEDEHSLPGGEQIITRTVSNPDANGALQVVQREDEDSKQTSPGVRVTNTTVLTPDVNGGFSPVVRTEQRETKGGDGTVQIKKSTMLADGTGGWKLSEVREGTTQQQNGQTVSKDERVLRPDVDGNLAVIERTVTKQTQSGSGDKQATTETYSSDVPGVAGDGGLQLVRRDTTVQHTSASGARTTTRQTEQARPGEVGGGLQLTEQAIDIVRPGVNGTARQTRTILTVGSNGQLNQVWVDTGSTNNPTAVTIDTTSSPKPH